MVVVVAAVVVVAVAIVVAVVVVVAVAAVAAIYPTIPAPASPEKLSSLPKVLVWVPFH